MEGILEKIKQLGDPLQSEAIQRTKDKQTHKGYDTDGYGVQFCINRFNEIFGTEWGILWEIVNQDKGTTGTGKQCWEVTVKVGIWVIQNEGVRWHAGGHVSKTHFDALKGAITNGFKKAAALWGVGRHAYEGALDDDNDPWPEWAAQNGDSFSSEDIKESFYGKQNQQAQQPEPPAPPKNGNGHKSSQQNSNGHESSQQNEQAPSGPPAGNGKEAGLRRRIKAKLEMVCERSEERMNKWLVEKFSTTLNGLESLTADRLQQILDVVDQAFEAWKAGK